MQAVYDATNKKIDFLERVIQKVEYGLLLGLPEGYFSAVYEAYGIKIRPPLRHLTFGRSSTMPLTSLSARSHFRLRQLPGIPLGGRQDQLGRSNQD